MIFYIKNEDPNDEDPDDIVGTKSMNHVLLLIFNFVMQQECGVSKLHFWLQTLSWWWCMITFLLLFLVSWNNSIRIQPVISCSQQLLLTQDNMSNCPHYHQLICLTLSTLFVPENDFQCRKGNAGCTKTILILSRY